MNRLDAAIYRLLRVPVVGERALGRVLTRWRDEPPRMEGFWGRSATEYRSDWGLSERAAAQLERESESDEGWEAAEREARRAWEDEIELLSVMQPEYEALAADRELPPVLFTRGNQDLLWHTGVAIPHSKDAPEEALAWGCELAAALSERGHSLVSGHNRDGYRRVAAAGKRLGAPLVIVLDRPLHGAPSLGPWAEPVATARLWDERFRPERELVVSPFRPGDSWSPRHARGRDGLIVEIAAVIVAGGVRPDGTIRRLCDRVSSRGRPVYRSPYCRADLSGALLPVRIEEAAEIVAAAAAALPINSRPAPTWAERRWESEVVAFIAALEVGLGPRASIHRWSSMGDGVSSAGSATGNGYGDEALTAVVEIPPMLERVGSASRPAGSEPAPDSTIVIRRRGVPGSATAPVLVLAPGEPIHEVAALRGYLARCRTRVESAFRTPRASTSTAPGPAPTRDEPPFPG